MLRTNASIPHVNRVKHDFLAALVKLMAVMNFQDVKTQNFTLCATEKELLPLFPVPSVPTVTLIERVWEK